MTPFIVLVLAVVAFWVTSAKGETVTTTVSGGNSPDGFTDAEWTKYDYLFKNYAAIYNFDWKILKAFALNESTLGLNAAVAAGEVSEDGLSYGLMQLTFPTAKDQAGRDVTAADLNNAENSIKWAAKYVAYLLNYFDGNLESAVQAYNEGQGNVDKGRTVPVYLSRWQRNYKKVEDYSNG